MESSEFHNPMLQQRRKRLDEVVKWAKKNPGFTKKEVMDYCVATYMLTKRTAREYAEIVTDWLTPSPQEKIDSSHDG